MKWFSVAGVSLLLCACAAGPGCGGRLTPINATRAHRSGPAHRPVRDKRSALVRRGASGARP